MFDFSVEGRGGDFREGPPFIIGDARRVRVPQRPVFGLGCGELPVWLPCSTNLSSLESGPRVQHYLASVWSRVRRKMPAELRPVGDGLAANYAGLMQVAAQAPTTVVHGDLRLDNLFVRDHRADCNDDRAVGRQTSTWCAIDWQFVGKQRGAIDLAYFIGLSLTPSVRAEAEGALRSRSGHLRSKDI